MANVMADKSSFFFFFFFFFAALTHGLRNWLLSGTSSSHAVALFRQLLSL